MWKEPDVLGSSSAEDCRTSGTPNHKHGVFLPLKCFQDQLRCCGFCWLSKAATVRKGLDLKGEQGVGVRLSLKGRVPTLPWVQTGVGCLHFPSFSVYVLII